MSYEFRKLVVKKPIQNLRIASVNCDAKRQNDMLKLMMELRSEGGH